VERVIDIVVLEIAAGPKASNQEPSIFGGFGCFEN
jgi:hypothetical protein